MNPSRFNFRAWDKRNNVMHNCSGIASTYSGSLRPLGYNGALLPEFLIPSEYAIMQSTGLSDKNGKEIFEGDIVHGIFVVGSAHIRAIFVVECDKIRYPQNLVFRYTFKTWSDELSPSADENTNKVAGNIHENPELLK